MKLIIKIKDKERKLTKLCELKEEEIVNILEKHFKDAEEIEFIEEFNEKTLYLYIKKNKEIEKLIFITEEKKELINIIEKKIMEKL